LRPARREAIVFLDPLAARRWDPTGIVDSSPGHIFSKESISDWDPYIRFIVLMRWGRWAMMFSFWITSLMCVSGIKKGITTMSCHPQANRAVKVTDCFSLNRAERNTMDIE